MSKIKDFTLEYYSATEKARIVMKKELRGYFVSPIAYVVITIFLVLSGFMFFPVFFLNDRAEMRNFFELLPFFFSFLIPAVTMKLFAEERNSGSLETLLTMPFTLTDVIAGKILAASAFVAVMLAPTVVYPISIAFVGPLELGPVIGGYFGALLLGAAFSSIGIFASALSRSQIVSFIIAFAICIFLTLVDKFLVIFPSSLAEVIQYIGADYHFKSIARGVIDSRDIVYFASVIVLSIIATLRLIDERR